MVADTVLVSGAQGARIRAFWVSPARTRQRATRLLDLDPSPGAVLLFDTAVTPFRWRALGPWVLDHTRKDLTAFHSFPHLSKPPPPLSRARQAARAGSA